MKVYVVYRHYWPDSTSYAWILKSILEGLAERGHAVTVFTAQPSYNDVRRERRPWFEVVGGVRIVRVPLLWERKSYTPSRLWNAALFVMGSVVFGVLMGRWDLVMAVSTPPAIMGLSAAFISRATGAKLLYHCQDLHPEVGLVGGRVRRGWLYAVMMWAEKITHQVADAVVVLSEDMREAVMDRGLRGNNIHVLNNFMPTASESEGTGVPENLRRPSGEVFRVLFAGNHGIYQGLEHVVEAAHGVSGESRIRFEFVGDGAAKPALIAQAGELVGRTVFFHPWVSVDVIQAVMRSCDVGLVPLARSVYRYAFPSKVMTLVAAGLPLLVSVEADSNLATFVRSRRIGWVCPPADPAALAEELVRAFEQRQDITKMRERCQAVATEEFGVDANVAKWGSLVDSMVPAVP